MHPVVQHATNAVSTPIFSELIPCNNVLFVLATLGVNFYFTESDYRGREDAGEILVAVERDAQIASPVTLRVVPLNYTQFFASGLPIPRDVPQFDRLSPNQAKSTYGIHTPEWQLLVLGFLCFASRLFIVTLVAKE